MMFWKLLWQVLFIVGLLLFVYMFIRFSYHGFHELRKLLNRENE